MAKLHLGKQSSKTVVGVFVVLHYCFTKFLDLESRHALVVERGRDMAVQLVIRTPYMLMFLHDVMILQLLIGPTRSLISCGLIGHGVGYF